MVIVVENTPRPPFAHRFLATPWLIANHKSVSSSKCCTCTKKVKSDSIACPAGRVDRCKPLAMDNKSTDSSRRRRRGDTSLRRFCEPPGNRFQRICV